VKHSEYFVVVIPSPTTANIKIVSPDLAFPLTQSKLSLSCFSIHNGTPQNGHYRFVTLSSKGFLCISDDDRYAPYDLNHLNNRAFGGNFPDKPTILVYKILPSLNP
jgi:hypothetical protein